MADKKNSTCTYEYDYADKCDCSDDDKCGCTYPNNMAHDVQCVCTPSKEDENILDCTCVEKSEYNAKISVSGTKKHKTPETKPASKNSSQTSLHTS